MTFRRPVLWPSLCASSCRAGDLPPASVLEPTCGVGNFLLAALEQFPTARRVLGVEINPDHVAELRAALERSAHSGRVAVIQDSFFHVDWAGLLRDLPEPVLVLGNPPWVTNAQLGVLGSMNLPRKSNFQNHSGLDAVTGKSNFDPSAHWRMLLQHEQAAVPLGSVSGWNAGCAAPWGRRGVR